MARLGPVISQQRRLPTVTGIPCDLLPPLLPLSPPYPFPTPRYLPPRLTVLSLEHLGVVQLILPT